MNKKVSFTVVPAERSLQLANSGRMSGEVNRVKGIDQEYNSLIPVPIPVNYLEGMAYTKYVPISITGWDSLRPYMIGIRRGTKFAEKGTKGMKVELVSTNLQLFEKLYLGRHDVVVTSRLEGLAITQIPRFSDIKAIEPPIVTLDLFHYLNKQHSHLVPQLTSILLDMQNQGEIQGIRELYIQEVLLNHYSNVH